MYSVTTHSGNLVTVKKFRNRDAATRAMYRRAAYHDDHGQGSSLHMVLVCPAGKTLEAVTV